MVIVFLSVTAVFKSPLLPKALIFSAILACMFATMTTRAGVVWGPWKLAVIGECYECGGCTKIPIPPAGCLAFTAQCYRRDSSIDVIVPTTTTIEEGNYVACWWCPACCLENPCLCGSPPPSYCGDSVATKTENFSQIVYACISDNSSVPRSAIVAALTTAAGFTGATVSHTCQLWISICTLYAELNARVRYYDDVQAFMKHQWQAEWTGTGCPLIIVECSDIGLSMVIADIVVPGSGECVQSIERCAPYCE